MIAIFKSTFKHLFYGLFFVFLILNVLSGTYYSLNWIEAMLAFWANVGAAVIMAGLLALPVTLFMYLGEQIFGFRRDR